MTDVQISRAIGRAARVPCRAVAALVPFATTLAAAALAVAPSGSAVAQTASVPAWLNLPASDAAAPPTAAENLSVIVSATDTAGRNPGDPGFAGASRDGACRVFLAGARPVGNAALYDQALAHLQEVVQAAGGVEKLIRTPERIPAAHIWADAAAPWRCIAGTIYNVQVAGYPTVGFASTDAAAGGNPQAAHMAYFRLPAPVAKDPQEGPNRIVLTAQDEILWNGHETTLAALRATLEQAASGESRPSLEFAPEAGASYAFSAMVLGLISAADVAEMQFIDGENHREFAAALRP